MLANQMHRFGEHGGWWGFGGILPILVFLALIGVAVWAVLRVTSRRDVAVQGVTGVGPATPPNGALSEVRLRYARGEMSREEFVQRTADLGGPAPGPAEPDAEPPTPAEG